MLSHPSLKTLTVHTDWDLPLINKLSELAIFYYDYGFWDGINDEALAILSNYHKEDSELLRPLRHAYNAWLQAKDIVDFDFDAEDQVLDENLLKAETVLANELLEFHADPNAYIIVQALDEAHGDEAWFLCYLEDIEELGLDKDIKA
ncbi:MAG: hypothetical protein KC422_16780 [Trueperaceae bacterium]|nr:hypothetical protein [Trueperaceae bacterium]